MLFTTFTVSFLIQYTFPPYPSRLPLKREFQGQLQCLRVKGERSPGSCHPYFKKIPAPCANVHVKGLVQAKLDPLGENACEVTLD